MYIHMVIHYRAITQGLSSVRRPEKVLQVCVYDPLSSFFLDLFPYLAQGILCRSPSPISEVGVIEHRLEDRFHVTGHIISARRFSVSPGDLPDSIAGLACGMET